MDHSNLPEVVSIPHCKRHFCFDAQTGDPSKAAGNVRVSELSHFCDGCFAGLDGDDEGIECDADDVAIAGYHVADYTVERNNEARTKTTGDRAACTALLVKRAHELLSKRRGGAQLVLPPGILQAAKATILSDKRQFGIDATL